MALRVGRVVQVWRSGLALGTAIYIMLEIMHRVSALDNCQWQYVQVRHQQQSYVLQTKDPIFKARLPIFGRSEASSTVSSSAARRPKTILFPSTLPRSELPYTCSLPRL